MQKSERFLSEKAVLARVGASRMTLWRWQKDGLFPVRRQIGPRRVAWLESEIDAWISAAPAVTTTASK